MINSWKQLFAYLVAAAWLLLAIVIIVPAALIYRFLF